MARYFEETRPCLDLAYRKHSMAHLREITPGNFDERLSQFANEHGADPAKAVAVLVNSRPFIETFAFEDVAKAIEAELAAAK